MGLLVIKLWMYLHILDISPFSDIEFANLSFNFLSGSLTEQNLMKSNASLLSYMVHPFCVLSRKSLPIPNLQIFYFFF